MYLSINYKSSSFFRRFDACSNAMRQPDDMRTLPQHKSQQYATVTVMGWIFFEASRRFSISFRFHVSSSFIRNPGTCDSDYACKRRIERSRHGTCMVHEQPGTIFRRAEVDNCIPNLVNKVDPRVHLCSRTCRLVSIETNITSTDH